MVVDRPWYTTLWGLLAIFLTAFGLLGLGLKLAWQKRMLILERENNKKLRAEALENALRHKTRQITSHTLHLIQKNEALKALQIAVYEFKRSVGGRI